MCGISGFFSFRSDLAQQINLIAANKALFHRGPDDSGIFVDLEQSFGLAHTRLSIQDLSSNGHQPMLSADKRVVLVFNGEIYNFKKIRGFLVGEGFSFSGNSDTEVILNYFLYCKNNEIPIEKFLSALDGIFGLAIWDYDACELIIARDAFGVKPVYYTTGPDVIAFSSEIKGILSMLPDDFSGIASRTNIDSVAINNYITYLWSPGTRTPFKNVRKVSPGSYLKVSRAGGVVSSTWYVNPILRKGPSNDNSINDLKSATEGVRQRLRSAVHSQMLSDVPVGAFLSGGLDSSSVVAFAREANPNMRCFTIDTDGEGGGADLPYALRVAKHLGVSLEIVKQDPTNIVADLEEMVYQLDEPLADLAALNVSYISRLAKSFGIKVLLSGAGGDDVFSGYRRHDALKIATHTDLLPKFILGGLNLISNNFDQRIPTLRRIRKMLSGASLEPIDRLVNYYKWTSRDDLINLYSKEFAARLGNCGKDPIENFVVHNHGRISDLDCALAIEQLFYLPDHNLTYNDKMSMLHGVEVRVPFLDNDLVNYAAALPDNFKHRGMQGKWILKKAMEPYLPRDVIYRVKSGFSAPLRKWFRNELREFLMDSLSPDAISKRGIFNPTAVANLISDNHCGKKDASYTLLSILCVELWFKKFVDNTKNLKGVLL